MPRFVDRRHFLRLGFVLAGGTLALSMPAIAIEAPASGDVALARVLALVRSFAQEISVHPARPEQDASLTRLDADIADWARFAAALGSAKRSGVDSIRTEGSRVTMKVGARSFEIETRARPEAAGAPVLQRNRWRQ